MKPKTDGYYWYKLDGIWEIVHIEGDNYTQIDYDELFSVKPRFVGPAIIKPNNLVDKLNKNSSVMSIDQMTQADIDKIRKKVGNAIKRKASKILGIPIKDLVIR